jgi:P27 family predicted phage terminase small subunit
MTAKTKAPRHLKPATRRWWASVVADYELEPHHIRLLTLAAESWDRCQQAREAIAEHGLTFTDRHGSPRARCEVAIERDSRIAFARLLRELGLDVQPPAESRPLAIRGNAFRKVEGS